MSNRPGAQRRTGRGTEILERLAGRTGLDLRVLLLFLLALALLFGFGLLASEMREGETMSFDRLLLTSFRQSGDLARTRGPAWLEQLMIDFSALADVPMRIIMVTLVAGGLAVARRWRMAAFVLASMAGGVLYEMALKAIFHRARPQLVPHLVEVHSASFPSGHATFAAILYLTLAALVARTLSGAAIRAYLMACAVLVTLAVGLSRVYLGVHWPTDVIAGWAAGTAYALVAVVVAGHLQRGGQVERPGETSPPPLGGS